MIIDPGIFSHPRFLAFESEVGHVALRHLARLWAHCQESKRGEFWPGGTPALVECICTGTTQGGSLFALLEKTGWVTHDETGIRILGWNERNARLLHNWTANPSGLSKGRSYARPNGTPKGPPQRGTRLDKSTEGTLVPSQVRERESGSPEAKLKLIDRERASLLEAERHHPGRRDGATDKQRSALKALRTQLKQLQLEQLELIRTLKNGGEKNCA